MALIESNIDAGGAGDYLTFAAWEADTYNSATTSDDVSAIAFDNGTFDEDIHPTDTTFLTMLITVNSADRHDGTPGTGARVVRTSAVSNCLRLSRLKTQTAEWLEIDCNGQTTNANPTSTLASKSNNSSRPQIMRNLICHDISSNDSGHPIQGRHESRYNTHLLNLAIFNLEHTNTRQVYGIFNTEGLLSTFCVCNCTLHNLSSGSTTQGYGLYANDDSDFVCKNNLCTECTYNSGVSRAYGFSSYTSADLGYNASDDTTASATTSPSDPNSIDSVTVADEYVDEPNDNLLLDTDTAECYEAGLDLYTAIGNGVEVSLEGIDREAESVTWSISASQGTPTGGATAYPDHYYRMMLTG